MAGKSRAQGAGLRVVSLGLRAQGAELGVVHWWGWPGPRLLYLGFLLASTAPLSPAPHPPLAWPLATSCQWLFALSLPCQLKRACISHFSISHFSISHTKLCLYC